MMKLFQNDFLICFFVCVCDREKCLKTIWYDRYDPFIKLEKIQTLALNISDSRNSE